MVERLRAILRSSLSESEAERLERLTGGWTVNPFQFDQERGAFEVSEEWLGHHHEDSEEDVDLIIKACEILTERSGQAEREHFTDPYRNPAAGPFVLHFHFTEDLGVADIFRRLLEPNSAYRIGISRFEQGVRIQVGFRFEGEGEFQNRKQHIYWLLEVAQRLYRGHPYSGNRLW